VTERVFRLRAERVDWRLVEGEVIALDLESSRYLSINATGAAIWPLLVDGATKDALEVRLRERFGNVESIGDDVQAFLSDLDGQQLLDISDPS
jgi:Coenzyme PQQ synthesis protein D (PqqD)